MLFPERMYLVKMFVLKEHLEEMSQNLYDFGFIQIEQAQNFLEQGDRITRVDVKNRVQQIARLEARVSSIMKILGIRLPSIEKLGHVDISLSISEVVKDYIEDTDYYVRRLHTTIDKNTEEINEFEFRSMVLNLVEDSGLDYAQFKGLRNLVVRVGTIPQENLGDFSKYYDRGMLLDARRRFLGRSLLLCAALSDREMELNGILRNLRFEEIKPEVEFEHVSDVLDVIEFEIWQLREENAEARQELDKIRERDRDRLVQLYWILKETRRFYDAMKNFLSSDFGFIIAGWVPRNKMKAFNKYLQAMGDKVRVETEKADVLIDKGLDAQKVPTFLNHTALRPFERLLKFYGIPAYQQIDPTIFMASSFIFMFGIMFADVGHGLCLFFAGLIMHLFRSLRDASRILMYSGMSSSICGFLFGSFFGREDVIRPLWFSPLLEPQRFLHVGLALGVVMVSLGIFLNVVQNMRKGDLKEAVFSQWGMFSMLFYWVSLIFVVSALRYEVIALPVSWIVAILIIPLVFIVAGDFLFTGRKKVDRAETVFKPLEIVLGLLTNTVSFVRVAAFGLAHAALGASVYLVADNLGSFPGMKESVVVEGNIGVILLEGLIVFIQILRLEFYEFFSKFFHMDGKEFEPLKTRR